MSFGGYDELILAVGRKEGSTEYLRAATTLKYFRYLRDPLDFSLYLKSNRVIE